MVYPEGRRWCIREWLLLQASLTSGRRPERPEPPGLPCNDFTPASPEWRPRLVIATSQAGSPKPLTTPADVPGRVRPNAA